MTERARLASIGVKPGKPRAENGLVRNRSLVFTGIGIVCFVAAALSVGDGFASSGGAAAYRNEVNSICRSYTPRLKKVEADAIAAKKAGDRHQIAYDLGLGLALTLRQDTAIERVPVPAELQRLMASRLRRLRTIDGLVRRFFASARAGDQTLALVELQQITTLARPLNSMFDSAGLRDCGSNQT
jgi:hypothetical protein